MRGRLGGILRGGTVLLTAGAMLSVAACGTSSGEWWGQR